MSSPQTRFTILSQHDAARQLEVVSDADLPPFGPLQKRVQGIAAVASSHAGLTLLLKSALSDTWTVTVREGLAGVTTVRLTPR